MALIVILAIFITDKYKPDVPEIEVKMEEVEEVVIEEVAVEEVKTEEVVVETVTELKVTEEVVEAELVVHHEGAPADAHELLPVPLAGPSALGFASLEIFPGRPAVARARGGTLFDLPSRAGRPAICTAL